MTTPRNFLVSAIVLCMWLASFALLQGASHFDTGSLLHGDHAAHATISAALPAVADHHDELSADVEDDAPDDVCVEVAHLAFRAPPRAGIAEKRGLECARSQWLVLAARGPPST